jgi:ABC-type uncharacterized transport system permease subunit
MPGLVWFWAAAGLYGLAACLYFGFLFASGGQGNVAKKGARTLLITAFVVHTCEMGARGIAGLHPASSAREALGFLSWLIVGAFLVSQVKRRLDAVGTFVAPAAVLLLLAARLSPPSTAVRQMGDLGVLGRVHISLATAGLSFFALATALAVIYLVEDRQLKQKQLGAVVKRGIALETLDGLVHRCVQLGFPIFTVAMVTGVVWSARSPGGVRPEYVIAMVAWASFAALLVARFAAGWRGRRSAHMTIVGFGAALTVLVAYLARAVGSG